MSELSDHTLLDGTINGEGITSANGALSVPDRLLSSAIPVLDATYPIFFKRKSTFCSCDAATVYTSLIKLRRIGCW